jgi:hypothetical protein
MSKTRAYEQETLDIQKRYFDVMNELVDNKRLPGGLSGFCETYSIDRRHWYAQRADNGKGYFEVAWLIPLIKYFKVSSNWLLLGTGKMFKG